ncbi:hypothetical protein GYH30_009128 [Glycine max]|uniref:Uncharacterized protein n=1 Tax=Glycine soja TaxID=3848 RepID=A0A445KWG4_GLYSO|nr:hypothetical protein GYH30_009128 [Glycine max]RZC15312.1 hypothetical protein D0Y65_008947 [Glycine soja]
MIHLCSLNACLLILSNIYTSLMLFFSSSIISPALPCILCEESQLKKKEEKRLRRVKKVVQGRKQCWQVLLWSWSSVEESLI